MPALQPARGTQDILPDSMRRHRAVIDGARAVAGRYGFEEMATPIFEFTEVFSRPIGEATDIVSKEMYTFKDRGGEEVTLRPENTAGVVRAVISNGLTQSMPLRYFYAGPMFRYERPQKGRFRQFNQIGIEFIGSKRSAADVEAISLGADVLQELGVLKDCVLHLNTLGDAESRLAYRGALVEYFSARRNGLSEDSRRRLERNPLRILDSKDAGDIAINADAPMFDSYLTENARTHFGEVCTGLEALGISYTLDPRLVRGLDYYCHSAFEFVTESLGAQGTVLGGGRYDGLMKLMGGPDQPAVGWAAGVERLALLIAEPPALPRPIAVIPVGPRGEEQTPIIAQMLRRAGRTVYPIYQGNLGRRIRRAVDATARAAVILGDDELARGVVMVRDLDKGEQVEVPLAELKDRLAPFR